MIACPSTCPATLPTIPCQLPDGHDGIHRNGPLLWHDPPLILVGGQPVQPLGERDLQRLAAIGGEPA